MPTKTKLLLVLSTLIILAGSYLAVSGRASTIIGLTLTSNNVLENDLLLHWTFDSTSMLFSSSTAEIVDASGSGRYGDLNKSSATTSPVVLYDLASENARSYGTSPRIVFTDAKDGYVFFNATTTSATAYGCFFSKTIDGGTTWSAPRLIHSSTDLQTVCTRIAVWYDKWTPGDSGNLIHIAVSDATSDDISYMQLDTTNDATTTPAVTAAVTASLTNTNYLSITKATNGVLYVAGHDSTAAGVVFTSCSTTCTTAGNWTARAKFLPAGPGDDWPILMPVYGSSSVIQILGDQSANALYAKTYSTSSNTWGATTTIGSTLAWNTTDRAGISATMNPDDGMIYVAYVRDNSTYGTNDDFSTTAYNPTTDTWGAKTDILTNDARGLVNVSLSYDPAEKRVYAVYWLRATAGTANTTMVYMKYSDDGMTTWSAEQGPFNTGQNAKLGGTVNMISYGTVYGYWKIVNSAATPDTEGNIIAARLARSQTPGPLGAAIEFDGIDDYIATSTGSAPSGVKTVAFWMRTATTSAQQHIMNFLSTNTTYLWTTGTSVLTATNFTSPTIYIDGAVTSTLPSDNTWHHVTVTTGTGIDATKLLVGRASTTKSFGGSIDDVRLYSRALTAEEVLRLYGLGATTKVGTTIDTNLDLQNSLVGHWTLDGGSGIDLTQGNAEVRDRSGQSNHGNWLNHATTTSPGTVGQALVFDGADDYISVDDAPELGGMAAVTISAWANASQLGSEIGLGNLAVKLHSVAPDYSYQLYMQADNKFAFEVNNSSSVNGYVASQSAAQKNEWYHIVGVWSAGTSPKIYVNGVDVSTSQSGAPSGTLLDGNDILSIGASKTDEEWGGMIDDVRLYSRALTAEEVVRLYQLGATTRVSTTIKTNTSLTNGLVAHWTYDGKDMSPRVMDVSGSGNNITLTNFSATTTSPGVLGQAIRMPSTSGVYLRTASSPTGFSSSIMTVATWVRLSAHKDWYDFVKHSGWSGTTGAWDLYSSAVGNITFDIKPAGAAVAAYGCAAAFTLNQWHFIVGTYDGTTSRVYLDNTQCATTGTVSTALNTVGPFNIADTGSAATSFDQDDTRIYNRVLSSAEMTALYEMGN